MASKIPDTGGDVPQYITHSPTNSFILKPVSKSEVKQRLDSLDSSKSSADIPFHLIKIASSELTEPITYIINKSIQNGIVLDLFKISCITPVYKRHVDQFFDTLRFIEG